ncbi:ribonuclease P protein component [Campylobacter hyointestinalis]|uniref:ribonuclease P protein component n=1 Tax=Campylobacter hyointestinalis TaxID=198 RepID=UPI000DCEE166|nr:ribonuclease P protein component [Campylobacter hyointestinalis subsp. lawsonii]
MIIGRFGSISDSKEFVHVYQNAKKWHCDCAVVYFLESSSTKFAAIASKKVGKAVIRNRSKRLLRSAFYSFGNELKDGVYILIAKAGLEKLPYDRIQKSLKWSLKKVNSIL